MGKGHWGRAGEESTRAVVQLLEDKTFSVAQSSEHEYCV